MFKKSTLLKIAKIAVIPVTVTLMALAYGKFFHKNKVAKQVVQEEIKTKKARKKQQVPVTPADVIVDFNGVVFEVNKHKAGSVLGIGNVLSYAMSGHSPKNLENIMFDVLYRLDKQLGLPQTGVSVIHKDKPLPRVMSSWMRGDINGCDIITKLNGLIEELDQEGFFANDKEKLLIQKLGCVFFDPCTRVNLYKPIKKTVQLLKKCKALGHRVFLLSNIDTELITLLKKEYPEIFDLFDGMVLSAEARMIKPDANIYAHTMRKFNINPDTAVFLDDEQANCDGAQALITSIVFDQNEMRSIKKELAYNGILPSKHAVQMA